MDYTLKDLLDIPKLQALLASLSDVIRLPAAIVDIEGDVLTAIEWQRICARFHRANPNTEKICVENMQHVEAQLDALPPHVTYRCPFGLIETATPIVIEGKHFGNIFAGQLFTAPPDESYFIDQARQYGFDENE